SCLSALCTAAGRSANFIAVCSCPFSCSSPAHDGAATSPTDTARNQVVIHFMDHLRLERCTPPTPRQRPREDDRVCCSGSVNLAAATLGEGRPGGCARTRSGLSVRRCFA